MVGLLPRVSALVVLCAPPALARSLISHLFFLRLACSFFVFVLFCPPPRCPARVHVVLCARVLRAHLSLRLSLRPFLRHCMPACLYVHSAGLYPASPSSIVPVAILFFVSSFLIFLSPRCPVRATSAGAFSFLSPPSVGSRHRRIIRLLSVPAPHCPVPASSASGAQSLLAPPGHVPALRWRVSSCVHFCRPPPAFHLFPSPRFPPPAVPRDNPLPQSMRQAAG